MKSSIRIDYKHFHIGQMVHFHWQPDLLNFSFCDKFLQMNDL